MHSLDSLAILRRKRAVLSQQNPGFTEDIFRYFPVSDEWWAWNWKNSLKLSKVKLNYPSPSSWTPPLLHCTLNPQARKQGATHFAPSRGQVTLRCLPLNTFELAPHFLLRANLCPPENSSAGRLHPQHFRMYHILKRQILWRSNQVIKLRSGRQGGP